LENLVVFQTQNFRFLNSYLLPSSGVKNWSLEEDKKLTALVVENVTVIGVRRDKLEGG